MCELDTRGKRNAADFVSAPDDLHSPSQLRSLLKDLREVRQAKVRQGLRNQGVFRGEYLQVCTATCRQSLRLTTQVTNLTPLELSELKPFLVKAMRLMQRLEPKKEQEEDLDL